MLLCHGGREAQATRDPPTTVAPVPGFSSLVSPLGKLRGRRLSCDQEEGAGSEDLALPGPPPGCAPPGPWVPGPGLCGSQDHRPPAPAVSGRGSPGGWVGPVGRGPRSEAVYWLWAPRKWGLPLGVGWEGCPRPPQVQLQQRLASPNLTAPPFLGGLSGHRPGVSITPGPSSGLSSM